MSAPNPTFLLLRGLMREQRHWGSFPEHLQQQFPHSKILSLDIPGNGRLYQSESPKNIQGMTEALRTQLTQSNLAEPVVLLALSMGGMIAIDWMLRYPEEIAAGILVNTSAANFSPFYQRLRWQSYPHFFKMFRQSPLERENTILALTSNHEQTNNELLNDWHTWQQECPVSLKNARNQMTASATFKAVQKPRQPTLLVTSKADQLVDYRCSLKLQQAWQVTLVEHLTAGHDIPLDDPIWLSQTIHHWFSTFKN